MPTLATGDMFQNYGVLLFDSPNLIHPKVADPCPAATMCMNLHPTPH